MKTLIIILLIAAIIGLFTVPSQKKFNNYLVKKGKDIGKCIGPTGIRHYSYKVFSIDYVDYCVSAVSNSNGIITPTLLPAHTDKYLGIFGIVLQNVK